MNITLYDWLNDNDLKSIILNIAFACKKISNILKLNNNNYYRKINRQNYHLENVLEIDNIANNIFLNHLASLNNVKLIISEENDDIIKINKHGLYTIAIDPLDGSSNCSVNIPTGSIFAIYNNDIIAAGYVLYGPATVMILTLGHGVFEFTLDVNFNKFFLTHSNIKIKPNGSTYSINESNNLNWDGPIQHFISNYKKRNSVSARYVGSMVADIHRTLLNGGIFIYPRSTNHTDGKLRYFYEVAPMSFIIEQAGGLAIIDDIPALNYIAMNIHERVPCAIGSYNDIKMLLEYYN